MYQWKNRESSDVPQEGLVMYLPVYYDPKIGTYGDNSNSIRCVTTYRFVSSKEEEGERKEIAKSVIV